MPCILCNGKLKKAIALPEIGARAFCRCESCGLFQMDPLPTDAELSAYYQKYDVLGERDPYYSGSWGEKALDSEEGQDAKARFAWAKKHCGTFGRALDVGSGPGLFLRLAKADGASPSGVELNARAAECSARELGVPVVAGTIADAQGEYDAIAMWDLLEHVNDPRALVVKAASLVKPGGWLFIETPNEAALLDRVVLALARAGIRGPAATFYGLHHLVLFRPETASRLLAENGFEAVEIASASTSPGRVFRGKGFKDRITRLGLSALFFVAKLAGRQNKMLIAARKRN